MLKRLQKEKERAEAANREKTRFLANVSHEVRTPLNAIVGFSGMLDKTDDRVEQKRCTKHIKDASNSLMALVDGVLDFSRIESGHVKIKQDAVNLYELLDSVEGMFSVQAQEKGLEYQLKVDASLPANIRGDKYRLQQILVNLVGNAIKFTNEGVVGIHVTKIRLEEGTEQILFEIVDTGEGIQPEVQPHIFERFRQADDSVQRRHGGTGLGTAIAKHLVELMHGKIGLESEPGKGSRFWFSIPLVEGQQEESKSFSKPDYQFRPGENNKMPELLVADDSELNRHVMKDMLEKTGVHAEFSESGVQALEKLGSHAYDMIILDVQMPGMSGFEVIDKFRYELNGNPDVPFVVITGDATLEVQDECDRLGVAKLMLKPVDYDELRYTIFGLLFPDRNTLAAD
jgi:CheY-like chemotaxis protein/two-component sensor histidine kinase